MPTAKKSRKSTTAQTPVDDPARLSASGVGSENEYGTPQPGPSNAMIEQLNFANIPLSFKSQAWTHRRATTKATKRTLKQIQLAERERAGGKRLTGLNNPTLPSVITSERNSRRGTPVAGKPKQKSSRFLSKAAKEELAKEEAAAAAAAAEMEVDEEEDGKSNAEEGEKDDPLLVKDENGNVRRREIITWFTPEAHPSLRPTKKYCDITGLPARYTDPKTKLRYHDLEVYNVIRQLGPGQDQQYLMLRGAQQTLM